MQRTLIILMAPSGAGKTSRVNTLYSGGDSFHVNRDRIVTEVLEADGIDARVARPEDWPRIKYLLSTKADTAYNAEFDAVLKNKSVQRVVIDYPPGIRDAAWVMEAVQRGRKEGMRIEAEGIFIDPRHSLSRVLNRNAIGIDAFRIGDMLLRTKENFSNWLQAYRNFPAQFQLAAMLSDEARLFDNTSISQKLKSVAVWNDGDALPTVQNAKLYKNFLNLEFITPKDATFTVTMQREGNGLGFQAEIKNLHGPRI